MRNTTLQLIDKSALDRAITQAQKASAPNASAVTAVKIAVYTANFNELVRVDPTGGAFTVTLPAITSTSAGQEITVKNVTNSATAVSLDGTGADTIDGSAAPLALTAGFFFRTLVSDGVSNWMITSS